MNDILKDCYNGLKTCFFKYTKRTLALLGIIVFFLARYFLKINVFILFFMIAIILLIIYSIIKDLKKAKTKNSSFEYAEKFGNQFINDTIENNENKTIRDSIVRKINSKSIHDASYSNLEYMIMRFKLNKELNLENEKDFFNQFITLLGQLPKDIEINNTVYDKLNQQNSIYKDTENIIKALRIIKQEQYSGLLGLDKKSGEPLVFEEFIDDYIKQFI